MSDRVAVVGGGIAGLATAFHLARAGADPVVFERDDVPGGIVAPPIEVGDLWLEPGPDSLAARKPWGADLCRRLGLTLIAPGASGAFLWTDSGLGAVPEPAPPSGSPATSVTCSDGRACRVGDGCGLSGISSKRKRRDGDEETLGELLRRRLGDEATDLAIAPLLAGLHAGDVDRLSASATFPELLAWERTQGSLIRGAQAAQRSARGGQPGPLFVRPSGGMRELVDALTGALGDRVRTGAEVTSVGDHDVQLADGSEQVDAVVLACGAQAAAALLGEAAPTDLSAIRSVSTGVVFLTYPSGTADALPDGTGFVVPRGKAPMTATTFLSRKWPDERFGDRAIVRCYVGGAGDEDVLDAPDEDIVEACARHLSAVLDLPEPSASRVHRWWRAMPQYEIGHLDRVRRIREAMLPGIFLVGSAFDGVGVSDLARAAEETASLVLEDARAPRKEPA